MNPANTHPNQRIYAELNSGGVSTEFVMWMISKKQAFIEKLEAELMALWGEHDFTDTYQLGEIARLKRVISLAKEEL